MKNQKAINWINNNETKLSNGSPVIPYGRWSDLRDANRHLADQVIEILGASWENPTGGDSSFLRIDADSMEQAEKE